MTKKKKPPSKTKKTVVNNVKPKPKAVTATRKKPPAKTVSVPTKTENTRKILEDSGDFPDVGLDLCGINMKGRQLDFLRYYLTPGNTCFNNARQAAIKAGYTTASAGTIIYKMLRDPEIQKIVEANRKLGYQSLHEAAKKAIEVKKQRAFYDPVDYFKVEDVVKKGKYGDYMETEIKLKPLEKMTEMQRMCIDGAESKGERSKPAYTLPDRAKELNDIIKLDAEWSKSIADTGEEETREIIIERITMREAKRAQYPAELEYEIIEDPVEVQAEDEDNV